MSRLSTLKRLWRTNKREIFPAIYNYIVHLGVTNGLSDETYLKITYRIKIGNKLNLEKPETFNEKIQWLKIHDRNPIYTTMVDKVEVKKYISDKIGEKYIIPTLGVWEEFSQIDWEALPERFILKCSHDSGSVVICEDKKNFDITKAGKKLKKKLSKNAFYWGREWPYKDVKPRIIAEEYLSENANELKDYKFMCFNGKVKCSFVTSERFSESGLKVTFFDRDWNVMPFERHYPKSEKKIECPQKYDEMVRLAEILSEGIPFVRVDFYEVNGNIYFGELTFSPGCGFEEFTPQKWDSILGSWITLPVQKEAAKYM
ncbi:MAG: glycosyl transferase [Lachnospiraceae bacterium]|nr:glycosyl transferase [Lachnospiraceae bacterium]